MPQEKAKGRIIRGGDCMKDIFAVKSRRHHSDDARRCINEVHLYINEVHLYIAEARLYIGETRYTSVKLAYILVEFTCTLMKFIYTLMMFTCAVTGVIRMVTLLTFLARRRTCP
jgi:hypothetical protein